jgi:ElaB/YqjD/DUF883 family membrane-anchored ribosome-binding protein
MGDKVQASACVAPADDKNRGGTNKMDAQGRNSASDAAVDIKEQVGQKAAQIKDSVADLGRKAGDKIDEGRVRAAGKLESTASSLHTGGDRIASTTSKAMHTTADKIQVAAEYLREHDTRAMVEDLEQVVRRHPGAALAAAAVVGFFAGRTLRNGG